MTEKVFVVTQGNILKDGPGIHGSDIAGSYLYPGTTIVALVDNAESPHDGWALLVGPKPDLVRLDGTYLNYKKEGWFPLAHLTAVNAKEHEYRVIVDADTGDVKSVVKIR